MEWIEWNSIPGTNRRRRVEIGMDIIRVRILFPLKFCPKEAIVESRTIEYLIRKTVI